MWDINHVHNAAAQFVAAISVVFCVFVWMHGQLIGFIAISIEIHKWAIDFFVTETTGQQGSRKYVNEMGWNAGNGNIE